MPTKHERISVVKDPELAEAIEAARREPGAEQRPAAAIVRDLALRGAAAQREQEDGNRRKRRELAEMVQSGNPPWDLRCSRTSTSSRGASERPVRVPRGQIRLGTQRPHGHRRGVARRGRRPGLMTCSVVRYELQYSTQDLAAFDALGVQLAAFGDLPVTASTHRAAHAAMRELAAAGPLLHRVPLPRPADRRDRGRGGCRGRPLRRALRPARHRPSVREPLARSGGRARPLNRTRLLHEPPGTCGSAPTRRPRPVTS